MEKNCIIVSMANLATPIVPTERELLYCLNVAHQMFRWNMENNYTIISMAHLAAPIVPKKRGYFTVSRLPTKCSDGTWRKITILFRWCIWWHQSFLWNDKYSDFLIATHQMFRWNMQENRNFISRKILSHQSFLRNGGQLFDSRLPTKCSNGTWCCNIFSKAKFFGRSRMEYAFLFHRNNWWVANN